MKLNKIELYGFKSFARRTEFLFGPGITGIVASAIGRQDINIDTVSHNRHASDNAVFAIATMPTTMKRVRAAIKDIQDNHPGSLLGEPRVIPILN